MQEYMGSQSVPGRDLPKGAGDMHELQVGGGSAGVGGPRSWLELAGARGDRRGMGVWVGVDRRRVVPTCCRNRRVPAPRQMGNARHHLISGFPMRQRPGTTPINLPLL